MKRGAVNSLLLTLALVLQACATVVTTDAPKCASLPKCGEVEPVAEAPRETPLFLRGFSLLEEWEYPAVGCIADRQGNMIGSAVLIHPKVALTAAHCVEDKTIKWFVANGVKHSVRFTVSHPKCSIAQNWVFDVALVFLDECSDIEPMKTVSEDYRYRRMSDLVAVGYGGGMKKKSDAGVFHYYGTLVEEPWVFKVQVTDGTVWFGDSGGAMINPEGELVGVISSLGIYDGSLYENSAVRLDLVIGWIHQTVEEICN